jgi:hypothetical protein
MARRPMFDDAFGGLTVRVSIEELCQDSSGKHIRCMSKLNSILIDTQSIPFEITHEAIEREGQ